MIATTSPHFDDELLQQLLDETLDPGRVAGLHLHLAQCDCCRQSLERLAADEPWWRETVSVLAAAAKPEFDSEPTSPMLHWLEPILDVGGEGNDGSGLGNLDRYPIANIVGQGGMGVVLRGYDKELNRPVAIKVLSPHLAGVGAARVRFMREAQAAAGIVHPSIVPIYSVVTTSRLPYLVMPMVEGGNLQQRLDREGPLAIDEVLRIGLQVAEGLAAAHRCGVIHRDVKPSNVLIEAGNGRVLISDFGLARALDDASITCSGMIAGTPQFMSPEQARGEPLDARSDLFSLGSLLYALATGRPPFRADNPLAVLKKVTETTPRPVHQVNERMPPWLSELIAQLMTIRVADRIASADAAADLLRQAHSHVCNPAIHPLPKDLTKVNQRRLMRWPFMLAAMLMLIGVPIVLLAAWMTSTDRRQVATSRNQPIQSQPMPVANPSFGPVQAVQSLVNVPRSELESLLFSVDQDLTQLERELSLRKD